MSVEMDENKEVLTVAICAYNAAKYIVKTLESLENQSYKDFELVLYDDCSVDETKKIAEEWLEQSSISKYSIISARENRGIAYARNYVLHRVKTKYLIFFDADDIALPNLLEKLLKRLLFDKNLIVVGCYEEYIDENGNTIFGGTRVGCVNKDEAIKRAQAGKLFFLPMRSMLVTEEAIRVGGFRLDGFPKGSIRYADYCEDCDLWTRMSDLYVEGKYLLVIPEILVMYRKHNHSVSSSHYEMLLKMKYIKKNVLRRREGKSEIDFTDFLRNLDNQSLRRIRKEADSSDALRGAIEGLYNHDIVSFFLKSVLAVICSPNYVFSKCKNYLSRRVGKQNSLWDK